MRKWTRRKAVTRDLIMDVEIRFGGQRDVPTQLVRRLERRRVQVRCIRNPVFRNGYWVRFNICGPQHSVRQSLLGELTTLMEELGLALREQTYWPGSERKVVGENNPLGVSRVYWSGKGQPPPAIHKVESAIRRAA